MDESEYIVREDQVDYGECIPDLERIVRCKDCIKSDWDYDEYVGEEPAGICRRTRSFICEPDGFCAWGERSEDV